MKQDEVRKQSLTYFVNYFYPVEDEMNFPNVLRSYTENVKGILIDTNTFDATFFPDGAVSYAISCEFSYITIEIFGVYKGTKILTLEEAKEMLPDENSSFPKLTEEVVKNGKTAEELMGKCLRDENLQDKFKEVIKKFEEENSIKLFLNSENENVTISVQSNGFHPEGMVLLPGVKVPQYIFDNDFVILNDTT